MKRAAVRCTVGGLILAIALAAARATPAPAQAAAGTAPGATCDLELVRSQVRKSYPGYRVDVASADQGVVVLLLRTPDGEAAFAIALRAVGTRLSSSVTAIGADESERARVAEPIATWWQRAALQEALAACSASRPAAAAVDLGAAARSALRPEILQYERRRLRPAMLLGGAAWVGLAMLVFVVLLRMTDSAVERAGLLGLFVFALLLNWLLCAGGPGDLRLNLAAVWQPDEPELHWGPAPVALFRLLAYALGGIRDVQIQSLNLVLSSLLPVLVYAIIVELGVGKLASLLAAFVTAAHPLAVAFSADLGRQPTYLFAALGSILGLVGFLTRGGIGAVVAFVLGTILAVTSRPEGAHVLVPAAAVLVLAPAARRRRGMAGLLFGLLAALAFVYVRYIVEYGGLLAGETRPLFADPAKLLWTVILCRDFTPLAWILVWTIGLALGLRRRAAWVAVAMLVGVHIAWSATGLYASFVGYDRQVASARYESILLLPFAIGTALFADSVLARGTWAKLAIAAAAAAFTLMTYPRAYDTLLRPFTIDYEYRFLRRHALSLPAGSAVYVLQPPVNDVGFVDANLVGLFVGRDVPFDTWNPLQRDGLPSGADSYLYIGSACAGLSDQKERPLGADFPRWLQTCAAIRAQVAPHAIEESDVPAHKMSWHDFTQPTVRLGLYRMSSGAS